MLALIVLNYNDYETTESFINCVRPYENIDKIIVVDNCSTDKSYEKLSKLENEKINVIQTDYNKGYAAGNDFGIQYAVDRYNPDFLVISNPDVEFEKKTLDVMCNVMKEKNRAGVVTCMMNCTSGIELPVAWKLPTYKDCLIENLFILKKILGNSLEYDKSYFSNEICEVDVVPGSFFMISTETYKEIGGFDKSTFLYYEENILSHRLKENSFVNYICTDIEYIHRHSVSINKSINSVRKRLRMCYESRLVYCANYLKVGTIQKFLLWLAFEIGTFNYLVYKKIFP